MKDVREMTNKELLKHYYKLYLDLAREIGDKKTILLLLLEIERELTLREEQPY